MEINYIKYNQMLDEMRWLVIRSTPLIEAVCSECGPECECDDCKDKYGDDKEDSDHRMESRKPKLGSGKRFKNLTSELEKEGNSKESAQKISAAIGIKKYGSERMSKMAKAGKK